MTDYTVVGNDMHGAELRINDRVRIAHPGAGEQWRNREAVITAKHKAHFAEHLSDPTGSRDWVSLGAGCVAPTAGLERVA